MYTAPEVFTPDEVALIHRLAKQIPIDHARTGHQLHADPDADPDADTLNPTVRQGEVKWFSTCLLYTSPSPRDRTRSRMPSSA